MDWRGGGGGWEKRVCESVFFCAWKVSESVDAWKECVWRGIGGRERLEGLGGDQASVFCLCVYSSTCMDVDTSDLLCAQVCARSSWCRTGFSSGLSLAFARLKSAWATVWYPLYLCLREHILRTVWYPLYLCLREHILRTV